MDFHQGHVFAIAGLVLTLLGSIVLLLYKDLDHVIGGIYKENPSKARKAFAVLGFILFVYLLISLVMGWDRVDLFGNIFF